MRRRISSLTRPLAAALLFSALLGLTAVGVFDVKTDHNSNG
jgi:hypothetical protein